jgi:hypothetical protein
VLDRGVCCLLLGRCAASLGGWCPMCRDSMAVKSSSVEISSYEYSVLLNVRFITVVLYLALVYLFPITRIYFFLVQEFYHVRPVFLLKPPCNPIYQLARHHVPYDWNLHEYRCENFRFLPLYKALTMVYDCIIFFVGGGTLSIIWFLVWDTTLRKPSSCI